MLERSSSIPSAQPERPRTPVMRHKKRVTRRKKTAPFTVPTRINIPTSPQLLSPTHSISSVHTAPMFPNTVPLLLTFQSESEEAIADPPASPASDDTRSSPFRDYLATWWPDEVSEPESNQSAGFATLEHIGCLRCGGRDHLGESPMCPFHPINLNDEWFHVEEAKVQRPNARILAGYIEGALVWKKEQNEAVNTSCTLLCSGPWGKIGLQKVERFFRVVKGCSTLPMVYCEDENVEPREQIHTLYFGGRAFDQLQKFLEQYGLVYFRRDQPWGVYGAEECTRGFLSFSRLTNEWLGGYFAARGYAYGRMSESKLVLPFDFGFDFSMRVRAYLGGMGVIDGDNLVFYSESAWKLGKVLARHALAKKQLLLNLCNSVGL